MRNFPTQSARAFTLVELLLAATISAIVLGSAFVTLSVVLRAYKDIGGKTNMAETSRLILARMRTDLESAFLSPHGDVTRFVGYDQMNGDFAADSLTFISSLNKPQETGEGTSDLVEIQYYIDVDDSTPEKWLLRRFDATPDTDPFSGGQLALLGPQVVSLDFQFYDGTEWMPEWDSSVDLPMAVTVTVGMFEPHFPDEMPSLDAVESFSTTVWIPCSRGLSESTEEDTTGSGSSTSGSQSGGGGQSRDAS